ncbi:MAG: PLP-dependent cysteine synthase family protein [Clostridia bacterium]|nr:PLP-dependent cysteine synthase family protein [Clostridia bacterium]
MNIKIGNTPMIKIKYEYKGKEEFVFSKLESYNITGSIKDRVAYYIIKRAYEEGKLKKGVKIVEATSGNTGISLAAIGRYFKNPVYIFMPNWVSKERTDLMKMYNAEITLVSKEEGGFKTALEKAKKYANENKAFLSDQFSNINNILAHYETTGCEIIDKLGSNIGGFISGIGTGGTLMGTGKRLKEFNENIKIYALEPDKMPMLSQNKIIENHKIEGIGDDFIPDIVDRKLINEIITVNDEDSINMSRKIALDLGIGVGISSGANMIGSIIVKEKNQKPIVTVFPDDNKKYLSTDLSKPIDNNPSFVSNKVKLLDYEFIN